MIFTGVPLRPPRRRASERAESSAPHARARHPAPPRTPHDADLAPVDCRACAQLHCDATERLWPVGWRGTAQGCASDRIAAIAPCGGLRSPARVPWLGRAAQAARPTQGARRPRPTPHPVPAHAAARTQRPICPPARVPRAPREPPSALARSPALAHRCAPQQRRGRQTATRRGVASPPPPSGGVVRARSPSARPGCRWRSSRTRVAGVAGGRRATVCVCDSLYTVLFFGSRSSAVAASPVSCKKIFTYSFTTRLTPSPLDVLCVWCSTAFVFLFYFKPRWPGRRAHTVLSSCSRIEEEEEARRRLLSIHTIIHPQRKQAELGFGRGCGRS